MIPVPSGVRVWLATGYTNMRKGFPSLSLQVQEVLRRDPLSGHLFSAVRPLRGRVRGPGRACYPQDGGIGSGKQPADRHEPRARHCGRRSEEHTSELQSLMRISYAVFCLKKKNTIILQDLHTN